MSNLSTSYNNSSSSSTFSKDGTYNSTFSGKDAYGGSTYDKSVNLEGQNLHAQKSLGSTSLTQQSSLGAASTVGTSQKTTTQFLSGSNYTGNINFGAVPSNVTSNYSIQRMEQDAALAANNKVLWAGETGPITMQHKSVCLPQEALVIKPEPIVVPQPPVVFQPDAIQIPQPPLMFQPEPIAIPLPPLTIQPEPVVIERPPLVIQPEPVVLKRPDIQMNPSFNLNLKYGCDVDANACVPAAGAAACPPGTVPASSLGLQKQQSLGQQSTVSTASSASGLSTDSAARPGIGTSIKNALKYEAASLKGTSGSATSPKRV